MKIITIKIKPHTTAESLDRYLGKVYREKIKVQINWDLTELKFLHLNKILLIKPVLNKHRANTRQYLTYSNVIISQPIFRKLLKTTIPLLNPERPFHIISPEEVAKRSPEYPQLPELEYPLPGQKQG